MLQGPFKSPSLTVKDFEVKHHEYDIMIVNFFAPWCHWCQVSNFVLAEFEAGEPVVCTCHAITTGCFFPRRLQALTQKKATEKKKTPGAFYIYMS